MESIVRDLSLAHQGRRKIEWAKANMPILRGIAEEFIREQPFRGLRVAVSVHVEAKTACLAETLRLGGAEVALTGCNPLSTQDDVAAALAVTGMAVFCWHAATPDEYESHLRAALAFKPHVVIDDGGDFAYLLHGIRREDASELLGGCEETTTGVNRLRILECENRLLYPVIAVNNARCKHLFDNRYGTGQSAWAAILSTTNLLIAGKTVVVAGYGMCGKGVVARAKGLGANVVVCEVDAVRAAEALMDGCRVMTMREAAAVGDFFITVTGCRDIIVREHLEAMKDGAVLCNAGHFDVEIDIPALSNLAVEVMESRPNIRSYRLGDGRRLHLLGEGRLVNLAAGDGHPVEIMDMSFALQALCARFIAQNGRTLPVRVHEVPSEFDEQVAQRFLSSRGASIDSLTQGQRNYATTWEIACEEGNAP